MVWGCVPASLICMWLLSFPSTPHFIKRLQEPSWGPSWVWPRNFLWGHLDSANCSCSWDFGVAQRGVGPQRAPRLSDGCCWTAGCSGGLPRPPLASQGELLSGAHPWDSTCGLCSGAERWGPLCSWEVILGSTPRRPDTPWEMLWQGTFCQVSFENQQNEPVCMWCVCVCMCVCVCTWVWCGLVHHRLLFCMCICACVLLFAHVWICVYVNVCLSVRFMCICKQICVLSLLMRAHKCVCVHLCVSYVCVLCRRGLGVYVWTAALTIACFHLLVVFPPGEETAGWWRATCVDQSSLVSPSLAPTFLLLKASSGDFYLFSDAWR